MCAAIGRNRCYIGVFINGHLLRALVDSGATGNFLSKENATQLGLAFQAHPNPYALMVADGTFHHNGNTGMIDEQTEPVKMTTADGKHTETISFDVMSTPHTILGFQWLQMHNPNIDWNKMSIDFRCQCGKRAVPQLKREDATLGSRTGQLCATYELEYPAQDSPLKDIPVVYHEYKKLFEEDIRTTLPKHQPWDHDIPLKPGKEPTVGPLYPCAINELGALKDYIDENLAKGFIRESKSSCGSPVLFVKKKDGSLRLVVDYRKLNDITVKDCYALPLINEIQDRLQGAVVYTKLDLRSAFNRIRMKEGEEWKTAFRTRYGLYEYTVMPFGLCNAPASMQRLINNTLREYLDVFCIAYLDDILIYSKSMEDHVKHVKMVLQKLEERALLVKPEKCEFHKTELGFLGYVVGVNGITMDKDKLEAVREWPRPSTVKEIQAFLGFANFYRRFIKDFSKIAAPLTELTKKDQAFNWTDSASKAFEELKKRFCEEPVLAQFDPGKHIVLETDASDFAMGACLNQRDDNGRLRPVAYMSKKLSEAELNYDVYDKEMLAIVTAMQQWRVYLEGSKYTVQVWTDHKNLIYFTTSKILNRRQVRWAETLASYNFIISYRKGSDNARADALSRRSDYEVGQARPKQMLKKIEDGYAYNACLATYAVLEDTELETKIKLAYPKDVDAKRALQQKPDITSNFSVDEQGLVRFQGLVYVPNAIKTELVRELHSLPAHGHQGIDKTQERIKRDFYVPGLWNVVKQVVSTCEICNKAKANRHAPYGLLKSPPTPDGAWKSIAWDFIVKLPPSIEPMTKVVYDSILVITDRLTKYGHFIPYKESSTATELAYIFLKVVVAQHGLPDEIISDRDKLFTSKFWQTFTAQLGINTKLSTAFHPQTDGQTERLNQTLEQYLRSYVNDQQDNWVELLPTAEFSYNSAPSGTTNVSPFFANYGYDPAAYKTPRKDPIRAENAMIAVDKIRTFQQQLALEIQFRNERSASYANRKRSQEPSLKGGDKVYLLRKHIKTTRPSSKLDWKKLGPYRIITKVSDVNYRLELPKGSRLHPVFHISLLEPAPKNATVETDTAIQPEFEPDVYEVEKILDKRSVKGRTEYLVKWKDYSEAESSWEPTKNLNCPDLLRQFLRRHPELESPSQAQPPRLRRSRRTENP